MLTEKQLKNYWDKVGVKGEDECWNWTAYVNIDGYGVFNFGSPGKKGLAHRVSAYITGLIPSIKIISPNDQVLHKCDNPACQNPKHFFIGSNKDNIADKVEKGRQLKGEAHGSARLTGQEVLEIRRFYAQGGVTHRSLAKVYNVTYTQIGDIVRRKTWTHI